MKKRANSLVLTTVAVLAVAFVSGCERQPATAPGAPATPTASVGTQIDDALVTTKVKAALVADKEIHGLGIKVETRKGTVQLSGFADTQAQADRAVAIAKGIEGVSGIQNAISLKQGRTSVGSTVDDGILTGKVKSALIQDPSVKALDIAVASSKGQVQLSGFVDNQAQIDQAIQVAKSVEGVTGVDNKMSLKK